MFAAAKTEHHLFPYNYVIRTPECTEDEVLVFWTACIICTDHPLYDEVVDSMQKAENRGDELEAQYYEHIEGKLHRVWVWCPSKVRRSLVMLLSKEQLRRRRLILD